VQTFFDVFGFITVLFRGLDLVARTVLLGSVLFVLLGLPRRLRPLMATTGIGTHVQRTMILAAAATIVTSLGATLVNAAMLEVSLDLSLGEITGAGFVTAGAAEAAAACAIIVVTLGCSRRDAAWRLALVTLGAVILFATLADSHAVARLSGSAVLSTATLAHQLGAALWLGGLPCFRASLRRAPMPDAAAALGRRYSVLSIAGVAMILASALVFVAYYIGSPAGAYGTAYGGMAITKTVFLAILLLLGFHNYRTFRSASLEPDALARALRFVGIETGVAIAVLMTAASITSAPPAVDLGDDRVTLAELGARWTPAFPRFDSPDHDTLAVPARQAQLDAEWRARSPDQRPSAFVPGAGASSPRNASDIAWSEYNHHWSGLIVLAMGIATLLARSGRAAWSRHWPLLFAGIAVLLLLRGDPEVWPLGTVGLIESLKDPEVLQHRVFALLAIGFAVFEWRVQTGRAVALRAQRVFPLLIAVGATLLVTHSHALGNVKEEVLAETTHLPIAVLGVVAGWSRWLELDAPDAVDGRFAAWIWPACFIVIGLLLLNYREA
jgi:copper resistance protein D